NKVVSDVGSSTQTGSQAESEKATATTSNRSNDDQQSVRLSWVAQVVFGRIFTAERIAFVCFLLEVFGSLLVLHLIVNHSLLLRVFVSCCNLVQHLLALTG
ncbi:unnamed protein product, partial [Amoebophrya sp. A25]